MVALNSVVVAVKELVSADLGEEVAILHLGNGIYYGLDSVGVRIWDLIQEPHRVNDILDILLAEYEVEPERCKQDLLDLLAQLADEGLLEISEIEAHS